MGFISDCIGNECMVVVNDICLFESIFFIRVYLCFEWGFDRI